MIRGILSAYSKTEAVLVAFRISKLGELKNLGPWKLMMENFLNLINRKPLLLPYHAL